MADTMDALHDVVKAGKVRYLGASSMWAWQFAKMQHIAESGGRTKFISMQDQYSLIQCEEEREMIALLADQGVGNMTWSPLGGGISARARGKRASARVNSDGIGAPVSLDADDAIVGAVERLARRQGTSTATTAVA